MFSKSRGPALVVLVTLGVAVLSGCTQPIAGTAVLPSTVADMPVPTLDQLCGAVPTAQITPLISGGDTVRIVPDPESSYPMLVCNLVVDGPSALRGNVTVSRPSQMLNSVADDLEQGQKTVEDGSRRGEDPGYITPAAQIPELTELEVLGHRAGYSLLNHPDAPERNRHLRVDVADDLVLEVFLGIDDGVTGDLRDPAPLLGIAETVMRAMQATGVAGDLLEAADVSESGSPRLCAAVPLDQVTALAQTGETLVVSSTRLQGEWTSADPNVACELTARGAGGESSSRGMVILAGATIPHRRSVAELARLRNEDAEVLGRSSQEDPVQTFTELQIDGYPALFAVLTYPEDPGALYRLIQVDLPGGGTLQMRLLITGEEPGDMADPAPIAGVASSILAAYRG